MKKITAIFLTFAMIFALAACGTTPEAETPEVKTPEQDPGQTAAAAAPEDDGWAKGNPAPVPDESFVVRKNNIKYLTYSVTSYEGEENSSYMQFYGMKDKAIEDAINTQIRHCFEELMDDSYVSPYPGLAEEVSSRGLKSSDDVYIGMIIHANFSDVLSVSLYRNQYFNAEDDYLGNSDVRTFNYDLNTGKQIKLADLLYDGADPEFFNNYVKDYVAKVVAAGDPDEAMYSYGMSGLMNSEFTGLKEDQKFYISEFTGDPVLVFDYDTPEFDTVFTDNEITVDLRGYSAIRNRFVSSADLFEDNTVRYMILGNDFDPEQYTDNSNYWDYYFDDANITCSVEYGYYGDIPEDIRSYTVFDDEYVETTLNEFRDIYDMYLPAYPEGLHGSAWMYAYPSRFGEFTNITRQVGRSIWTDDTYMTVYENSETTDLCFRGDSTESLTIEDIFKPGVDRKALMKKAFAANNRVYSSEEVKNADPEQLDAFFDAVIENVNGVYINPDYVSLSYSGSLNGIASSFFPDSENIWVFTSLCGFMNFDDLGCENLTIFD